MQTRDRDEFTELMRKLCAGFDRPPASELTEAFWDGCRKLSLRQFRLGVDTALENLDVKFPRPKQLTKLAYEASAESAQAERNREQTQRAAHEARYPPWLAAVNLLFFQWTWRAINRKDRVICQDAAGKSRSIPDVEMSARRLVCRQLADEFAELERDGSPNATREYMRHAFDAHMRAIPVDNLKTLAA